MKKYLELNQKIIFLCILFIIGIASLFLFASCDDSDSLYKVNIAENQNCTISTNKSEYYKDEQVIVYVSAFDGFEIENTYYIENGSDGKIYFSSSFAMPDEDITIYVCVIHCRDALQSGHVGNVLDRLCRICNYKCYNIKKIGQ